MAFFGFQRFLQKVNSFLLLQKKFLCDELAVLVDCSCNVYMADVLRSLHFLKIWGTLLGEIEFEPMAKSIQFWEEIRSVGCGLALEEPKRKYMWLKARFAHKNFREKFKFNYNTQIFIKQSLCPILALENTLQYSCHNILNVVIIIIKTITYPFIKIFLLFPAILHGWNSTPHYNNNNNNNPKKFYRYSLKNLIFSMKLYSQILSQRTRICRCSKQGKNLLLSDRRLEVMWFPLISYANYWWENSLKKNSYRKEGKSIFLFYGVK